MFGAERQQQTCWQLTQILRHSVLNETCKPVHIAIEHTNRPSADYPVSVTSPAWAASDSTPAHKYRPLVVITEPAGASAPPSLVAARASWSSLAPEPPLHRLSAGRCGWSDACGILRVVRGNMAILCKATSTWRRLGRCRCAAARIQSHSRRMRSRMNPAPICIALSE